MRWQENSTKRKTSKRINYKSKEANPKKQVQNENFFYKNTLNMLLAVYWNSKCLIKFENKAIRKREICEKQPRKTSEFQLK